jgi:hypothetical protein
MIQSPVTGHQRGSEFVSDGPNGLCPWPLAVFPHFALDPLTDAKVLKTDALKFREVKAHLISAFDCDTPKPAIGK